MYPAVIRRGIPFALASKTEGRGRGRERAPPPFFSPFPVRKDGRGGGKAGGGEGGMGAMIVAPDGPKWTAQSYVKVRGEGRR